MVVKKETTPLWLTLSKYSRNSKKTPSHLDSSTIALIIVHVLLQ